MWALRPTSLEVDLEYVLDLPADVLETRAMGEPDYHIGLSRLGEADLIVVLSCLGVQLHIHVYIGGTAEDRPDLPRLCSLPLQSIDDLDRDTNS